MKLKKLSSKELFVTIMFWPGIGQDQPPPGALPIDAVEACAVAGEEDNQGSQQDEAEQGDDQPHQPPPRPHLPTGLGPRLQRFCRHPVGCFFFHLTV